MKNLVFRKKSIEKISSPEQLNNYIRVANPGVWMILLAIIIFLIGLCAWGMFGQLESKLDTVGICKNGQFTCYIRENDILSVDESTLITVDGINYPIESLSDVPIQINSDMDAYMLHRAGLSDGEWVYELTTKAELENGVYSASVIIESNSPLSFVLNKEDA